MKKLSQKFTIRASGYTPTQAKNRKHFRAVPDKLDLDVRTITAATFLATMRTLLSKESFDSIFFATFGHVTDWDACIPYQGALTKDGFVPSAFMRRLWKDLTGWEVPAGVRLHHGCHFGAECTEGVKCSHRGCANASHFYLTDAAGVISKSQHGTGGRKGKIAAHKLTWIVCNICGADTTPGKNCAKCNAKGQAVYRRNLEMQTAEWQAADEQAMKEGELFWELKVTSRRI